MAFVLLRKHGAACDVAYAIFLASGILAGVTYLTGSLAEDTAKKLPGVTETLVEAHQEAALIALIITLLLGVAGAGGLFFRHFQAVAWARSIVGVLVLAAFVAMGNDANLGGQIRRPELRSGTDSRASSGQTAGAQNATSFATAERA